MKDILCERLLQKRKKAGFTQNEIASRLQITQSTYAGYETGKSKPSIDMLTKIADLYDTSIDYLVGRYN